MGGHHYGVYGLITFLQLKRRTLMTSQQRRKEDEAYLRQSLKKGKFEPFIRHIRFPFYKNLEPGTRIEFSYPITALVGQNGSNKSSILRALYGTPENYNIGDFWFSTAVDPIVEAGGQRNCYIYGYYNQAAALDVEVLIQRSPRKGNPDYWESSRPVAKHEMKLLAPVEEGVKNPPGRDKTRWNYIKKHVELLDFRSLLSAFDKLFYHNELRGSENSVRNRKEFARKRAGKLREAIELGKDSYEYYGERITGDNRTLNAKEVEWISRILGRDYESISLTRHKFYNCDGFTARMKITAGIKYTEAFAGSGEFAAIMLVAKVMAVPENSLVLLDEPEVSLHPGAQERLMEFLTIQAKQKKLQVVISTHSPAIIRYLPPDAIKVLGLPEASSRVKLLAQESRPELAFLTLGEPLPDKKSIIVEDPLAAALVTTALRRCAPDLLELVDIRVVPGGAGTIFSTVMPILAAQDRKDTLCLLDGDQSVYVRKFVSTWFEADKNEPIIWPNEADIPASQNENLADIILKLSNVNIPLAINSGSAEEKAKQLLAARRRFLGWAHIFLRYLPGTDSPDSFLLSKMKQFAKDPKKKFAELTKQSLKLLEHESPTASRILYYQEERLSDIPNDDPDLSVIASVVSQFFDIDK